MSDPDHTPRRYARLADLETLVGQCVGVSPWVVVDQARIDAFAHCTGDRQWIHVDPARAATGPFGTTIAHGFLTLSLLPEFMAGAMHIADVRMGVNYGLNRVRFPAPVPVDSRLRGHLVLQGYKPLPGGDVAVLLMNNADTPGPAKVFRVIRTRDSCLSSGNSPRSAWV
jgi:acyl dehydratase